jgi:ATPases of the AAA+ class
LVDYARQVARKSGHDAIEMRHLACALPNVRPADAVALLNGRPVSVLTDLLQPLGTYFGELLATEHVTAVIDASASQRDFAPIVDAVSVLIGDAAADQDEVKTATATVAERPIETAATFEAESFEDVLAELRTLVGLEAIKAEVEQLLKIERVNRVRSERDLGRTEVVRHLVFVGNPGTGKTTVARLIGRCYAALGVLSKGTFTEVSRPDLVAAHVGQTAKKTADVIASALGGVLFIDEAYALVQGTQDYGNEAVAELLLQMENRRDDLVVIVAGYPRPIAQFVESNPGLASRFARTIEFPDYQAGELLQIFDDLCAVRSYRPDEAATELVRRHLDTLRRDAGFGNARAVRNLLDRLIGAQAMRVGDLDDPSRDELMLITAEDCRLALRENAHRPDEPTGQYL